MITRKYWVCYPLALFVCVLAAMFCVPVQQLHRAEAERRVAIEQRNEHRNIALSRHLAWEARSFVKDRPDLALLLAVEACDTADTTEARASLLEALQFQPQMVRFLSGCRVPVREMAFGAGGVLVLAHGGGAWDASISFWDSNSGKLIGEPIRIDDYVDALAVSRDGNIFVLGSGTKIQLWDVRARRPLLPPIEASQGTGSLAFSSNGILAAGGLRGELQLWDSQSGERLTGPIQAHDEMTGSNGGGIFHSTSNGTSWTMVNSGLTNTLVNCLAIIGRNLFAGTMYGGVFLSTDNGKNWTAVNSGLTNRNVNCLLASGTNLFAGTDGGIFLSTNNGTSWTAINSGLPERPSITCLAVSGMHLFAGVTEHYEFEETHGSPFKEFGLYLSTDNGKSWTVVNSGLTNRKVNCLLASGTSLFAGTDGGVFQSANNGANWTAVNSGLPAKVHVQNLAKSGPNLLASIVVMDEEDEESGIKKDPIVMIMDQGLFLSTNNGSSWKRLPEVLWVTCFAASGTNLFAGTSEGVSLSRNNGTSWEAVSSGLPEGTLFTSLAVSGTNLFASTAGGGAIQSNSVDGLVFSPDGAMLLSGAADGTIRRWEGKSLEPIGPPIVAHAHGVASLVFHPDGKTLASDGDDGEIRLWTWPEMKPAGEPIRPHTGILHLGVDLAYTPDGVLLSTEWLGGRIHRWNGKTLERLGDPLVAPEGGIQTLAVRNDGMVATGYIRTVTLWDFKAPNRLLTAFPAHAKNGVAFLGGDQLAAAGEHGLLRFWSIRDRTVVREVHAASGHKISRLAVSASSQLALGLDNGFLQFADLKTGNLASPVHALDRLICMAFSPAGDRLVAGGNYPGSLRILDPQSNTPVTPLVNAEVGYLQDVAISPDGKVVAACGLSGIRLFDARNLSPITPALKGGPGGMNSLAFSPDGKLVGPTGIIIQFRDGMTGQPVGPAIRAPGVSNLVFASGGKVLAGGGDKGEVSLWDGKTLQSMGVLTGGENWVVRHLAASSDGRIAAAFDNGNLEIWDINLDSWKARARLIANRQLTPAERQRFLEVVDGRL